MAAQQWWLQIDQAMVGPMGPSELRALASHRKFDAETLVSSDKVRWVPARRLKGLFEPAHEEANTRPRHQAGADSTGSLSRSVATPTDREAGKEHTAGHHKRARADEGAPRFPILRTRSHFLWNDTVAIYDSHVLKGRRYWRRLAITEAMCHAAGEPALRGQFHRESRIEFDDVLEVRETTASRKRGQNCHFVVRSKHRRRVRFTLPALQAGNPRAALSLRLADRYWIREERWRDGCLGWLLILVAISIGGVGLAILQTETVILGVLGAVGTALGILCGVWGCYRLVSRRGWTKITEYAPQDLESADQPRTAPTRRSPIHSKPLGWTLKLVGLAYWLLILSPLTDGLYESLGGARAFLGIVILAPAPLLIFNGYRLCQRRYQPTQCGDDRKPVLFLRPFDDDMATSLQPSGFWAQLTGLRVGWLHGVHGQANGSSSLMAQAILNCYPVRLFRMFFDLATDSSEESLVRFFESYGPVIAIGKPGDTLAVPGAARMYLADDEWQEAVLAELRRAEAVVLQPGSSSGVHWEFEQIRALVEPHRLLLCLASFMRNPQGYEEMSRVVRETLMQAKAARDCSVPGPARVLELPRVVPFLDRPAFVYFDRDWAPRLQELRYKSRVLWPVTGDAADLKYTLKPFLQGMPGRKRGAIVSQLGTKGYYRDPRNPRDVFGPFAVDQLREFVKQGRLRATDQVSFDKQSWMPATELEPELFPAGPADWLAGQPAWKRTAGQAAQRLRALAIACWNYIKLSGEFYWTQRKEMRLMATEYLPFLKVPGTRREIRVTAEQHNEAVAFENDQWRADLPDCCIVCGDPADCDWNREQRSIPDLTWPFLSPLFGLLFGIVGWIFLWNSQGRWLIPLGVFAGFLVGYRLRRETIVTVRFRRCREHLNRTRLPWLRIFRKTLIIGMGDRKVWRRFYHGDRELETPLTVPHDFSKAVESTPSGANPHGSGPSYPTIPLVDDSEMESREGPSPSAT